jgi:hypothetical protein
MMFGRFWLSVRTSFVAVTMPVTQVTPAQTFNVSLDPYPRVMCIYDTCMPIPAFCGRSPGKAARCGMIAGGGELIVSARSGGHTRLRGPLCATL